MRLDYLLSLLIESAEKKLPPSELINFIENQNVKKVKYINLHGVPIYDLGYDYLFHTTDNEEGRLVIIEIDNLILQSGFQVYYKPKLFNNNLRKDFNYIVKSVKNFYKNEDIYKFTKPKLYQYFNGVSQCYVTKEDKLKVLTFRVTNTEIWQNYQH